MKFVIIALAFLSTICGVPFDNSSENDTAEYKSPLKSSVKMSEWFPMFTKTKAFNPEWLSRLLENFNIECANREMNIGETGNKIASMPQITALGAISLIRCQNERTEMEIIKANIKSISDIFKEPKFYLTRDCYMEELKKMDPTSKVLETFNEDDMVNTQDTCTNEIRDDEFRTMIAQSEKQFGGFSNFTCGAIQYNDIKKFGLISVILAHEENEELKKSEIEKTGTNVKEKLDKIFDCVIKSL